MNQLSNKKQRGFSLTELLIASVLSILVFGGVINLLIASDEVTDDTLQNGELQEVGTFILNQITQDVMFSGYWGAMTEQNLDANNINVMVHNGAAVTSDCIGDGGNNASFPSSTITLPFRNLWLTIADDADELGCIPDAKIDSAILQIKRGLGEEVNVPSKTRYYLRVDNTMAYLFAGNDVNDIPILNNGTTMEYQHRIYYIRDVVQGDYKVPVLTRLQLEKLDTATAANGKMVAYDMAEGVEYINFLMGLDKDADGVADVFLSAEKMNEDRQYWDQTAPNSIVAVKVFVLVRALKPDPSVTNNFTYHLGDWSFTANGDHYRRMLFSNTVTVANAGDSTWSE
ncbi:PilW family protein [Catenovulum sp. SM1970]|uniref:PilW family protein n=1 Tax=Marinifaba aquimaris TaxID=2741323 RepID=UPI001572B64E|nr:PilW family protein [Marinifaba aquimaris]NTS76707.1 PilW family protein [Marinifaba aquimaris]